MCSISWALVWLEAQYATRACFESLSCSVGNFTANTLRLLSTPVGGLTGVLAPLKLVLHDCAITKLKRSAYLHFTEK
jgi:hypothetical protein